MPSVGFTQKMSVLWSILPTRWCKLLTAFGAKDIIQTQLYNNKMLCPTFTQHFLHCATKVQRTSTEKITARKMMMKLTTDVFVVVVENARIEKFFLIRKVILKKMKLMVHVLSGQADGFIRFSQ